MSCLVIFLFLSEIAYRLDHSYNEASSNILAECTVDITSDGASSDDITQTASIHWYNGVEITVNYIDDPIDGYVNTTVTCQNNVSRINVTFEVNLREEITGGQLIPLQSIHETHIPAEFVVRVLTGSHIQV